MVLCECGCGVEWPVCRLCGGQNKVSAMRMMEFCIPCVDRLAREEDELCDKIYQAYSRDSIDRNVTDVVVVMNKKEDFAACNDEKAVVDRTRVKKELRMCERLFLHSGPISSEKLPFKDLEPREIVMILLEEVKGKEKQLVKETIREAIRKWHPDKFLQKHGHRIMDLEKDAVMERVKMVAQAINDYGGCAKSFNKLI